MTRTLLILLLAANAMGATYTLLDCAFSSYTNALAQTVDGDEIVFPVGSASWDRVPPYVTTAITIRGAGVSQTAITDACVSAISNDRLFRFTANNKKTTLKDLTISGGADVFDALIEYVGGTNIIHLERVNFINLRKEGVRPIGLNLGGASHCNFVGKRGVSAAPTGFYFLGEGNGELSWFTRPATWGDTNKFYIEHCGFDWESNANGAYDSIRGNRVCFRYNSVTNVNVGNHGSDSSGIWLSDHSWEVYENDFYNTSGSKTLAFHYRGGTGVWWNNRLHGTSSVFYDQIGVSVYRATYTNIYPTACCSPWGAITGLSPWDGNVGASGWPAFCAIGRTSPTTFHTNSVAPNGLASSYVTQTSSPAYAWNNTRNDTVPVPIVLGHIYDNAGSSPQISTASLIVQEGRDFFNDTEMPGYVPIPDPHPFFTASSSGGSGPIISGRPIIRGLVNIRIKP